MRYFLLATCILLILIPRIGIGDMDWCAYEDDGSKGQPYNYGPLIRANIIYVGFPEDEIPVPSILEYGKHGQLLNEIGNWLSSHSQGNVSFTEDSGILLPRGESLIDPESTAPAWDADLAAIEYPFAEDNARYGIDYAMIKSWWDTGATSYDQTMSILASEIFYKIYLDYKDEGQWPFGHHDQVNRPGFDGDSKV